MAKGTINKLKTTMDWEKILQMMQLTRAEFIKCTNSSYNQQQKNKQHHQKMGRLPK